MKKNNEKKYIIWSSECDFDDWKDDLTANFPDCAEDELYTIMYETNNDYLDDQRMNLSIIKYDNEIVCIGQLGLWNSTPVGYRLMHTNKPSECLYSLLRSMSEITFYVDQKGDFRADESHHDGINHYLYRAFKSGITETQKRNFLAKVYTGKATRKDITRYTHRIGADIAKVYGWKVYGEKG